MEKEMDVMEQYKNITNKLKKKFLKKPNLAEGSEQYESLARQQKAKESYHFAGKCFLAQARCEQSLANWMAEATALTEAARCYTNAHDFYHRTKCVSYDEELHSAGNSFSHAIRVYNENGQYTIAAQLSIELGRNFKRFGKTVESMQHFQRAIDLLKDHPNECLDAMDLLANAKLEASDYEDALSIYTNMFNLAKETASYQAPDVLVSTSKLWLCQCEINMLLLLLLQELTPQCTSSQHTKLLEKYTWDVDEAYLDSLAPWVVCETALKPFCIEFLQEKEEESEIRGGKYELEQETELESKLSSGLNLSSGVKSTSHLSSGSQSKGGSKGEEAKRREVQDYMGLELFFALQSLAMACQTESMEDFDFIEFDLNAFLNATQKHVTHLVLLRYRNKSKLMLQLLNY